MEPAVAAVVGPQDAIARILDEASRLSPARIVRVAGAYPADRADRQRRTHMLEVASARDGRSQELRGLRAACASSVQHAAAAAGAEWPLGRLGVVTDAVLAVQDAVLAIFLSDRLGEAQVAELSRPWLAVR